MFQLNINQEFNTNVTNLFNAWCQIDVIKRWFAPGDMTVPEASADVKVGGQYRIVMQHSDGSLHIVSGQYKEVVANQRLVFTWQWQDSPNTTLVTLNFAQITDNKASLELLHSEFVDQESKDKHLQGWNGCLANLAPLYE